MAGNTPIIWRVDIEKLLRKCTPYLRQNINPGDIYNDLLDLTRSDVEQIECQTSRDGNIRGMDKLLECIARRSRKCFFDFLVLLENTGYSEKSERVIKDGNLTNSVNCAELFEARIRYQDKNGDNVDIVQSSRQYHFQNVEQRFDMQNTPGAVPYQVTPPLAVYPPARPNQWLPQYSVSLDNVDRYQGISSVPPPLQHTQSVPCELGRFEPTHLPGNVNTFHYNHEFGQGDGRNRCNDNDSIKKGKDDFVQIAIGSFEKPSGQLGHRQTNFGSQGEAAGGSTHLMGRSPVPTGHSHHIHQNVGQQRVGTGQMDTSQIRQNSTQQDLSPFRNQNASVIQRDQPVSVGHQQGVPDKVPDDQGIGHLTDEVFNKLVEVLCRGEESPLWKQVGRKAGVKRFQMRSVESEANPAEAMLDLLDKDYAMTVKSLRIILRQIGCNEALQILGGADELQPNIEESDDENSILNNLGGRSARSDEEISNDLNTNSLEKIESYLDCKQRPEKVIENISSPVCREPHEHEQVKCENNPELSSTMSEGCSKSVNSVTSDAVVTPSGDESQNQVRTTVEPVEAETDQDNKNADMDAVCLSEDISANLREETFVDKAMPIVSTASDISNKTLHLSLDSMQENEPRDFSTEVSTVQAQGDANCSRSEKPPSQELVQLRQESRTQPNISSFRDIQHSVPTHQGEGLSTLRASGQNIIRNASPGYQGFQDRGENEHSDMNLECSVDRTRSKSTLSKNKITEHVSLLGKQMVQTNPELALQEISVSEESDYDFQNKANFDDHAAGVSSVDMSSVKAEGGEHFKQSVDMSSVKTEGGEHFKQSMEAEGGESVDMSSVKAEGGEHLKQSMEAEDGESVDMSSVKAEGGEHFKQSVDMSSVKAEGGEHFKQSVDMSSVKEEGGEHFKQSLDMSSVKAEGGEHFKQSVDMSSVKAKGGEHFKQSVDMSSVKAEGGEHFKQRVDVAAVKAEGGEGVDVSAVKAEGDEHFKQSVLPPNLDHEKFQREIAIQQSTSEDCREETQQSDAITTDTGSARGETNSRPHIDSFRDVQHSVPEYRSEDFEHPNSSLPKSVDNLVMDEDETFLKERNRPL